MVLVCTVVSWVGANDLDKFVAFVGCFAWCVFFLLPSPSYVQICAVTDPMFFLTRISVPLCYVYPAMLHYKACSRTRKQKAADIALIIFGLIAAAYTTTQTIKVRVSLFLKSNKRDVLML